MNCAKTGAARQAAARTARRRIGLAPSIVPGGAAPPWHALPAHEALARTASSADGLSRTQAQQRLAECGPNILPAQPAPGWLAIGLRQLKSPLIYVLLAAAVVSSALGDVTDAAFIGIVLLVNSVIGGWQEWRAERQSQSLL